MRWGPSGSRPTWEDLLCPDETIPQDEESDSAQRIPYGAEEKRTF
jgi:hypothetical protein